MSPENPLFCYNKHETRMVNIYINLMQIGTEPRQEVQIHDQSKKDGKVKPTDFVELDYRRKLQMAYEIMLNKSDVPFEN